MFDPLTEEQQRIVERNINLAYYYHRKYKRPIGMDSDDWMQEILIMLMQSVVWHDESKGQLATLLKNLIRTKWKDCRNTVNRWRNRNKTIPSDSSLDSLSSAKMPDLSEDHRDEMDSIVSAFPTEWKETIQRIASGGEVKKNDTKLLTAIRTGFGRSGSVACCAVCSDFIVRYPNRNSKYCDSCRVLQERIVNRESYRRSKARLQQTAS